MPLSPPEARQPVIVEKQGDVVVVNKPAGWVVHPVGPDSDAPILRTWLQSQELGNMVPAHRLDLGTSGLVLFADPKTAGELGAWFEAGEIRKTYQALVFGHTRDKGVIRRALKDPRRGKSLSAVTRYRTVTQFAKWALLEVKPETGRKHQIRRHLQGIGHAIVGDDRYRQRGKPTVPGFPGRLWLHASKLELPGGAALHAALPDELQEHLDLLATRDKPAEP